ncbi:Dystrobrevin beta [Dufourea novaeangliae]|uniref:Dystrobrevin beta n=1 Tax=Dufourea novaeangliae TaxID=178035 RepID=A0A154P0D3_DUFNO|nr:Dystrobrevin beta [Dufourea novaeangliae]
MAEDGAGGSGNGSTGEASRLQLLQEMRQQNFDSIRFASYRTACKLRFIQKKVHLHNVDIWNVIEAFRENGLNTLEPSSTLGVSRLETLLSSLFHALNKRVPVSQQAKVDATTALLMNWLLAAYTTGENNKISVFSVKVALATLCAGKLMDKFRYIHSQISDSNGHMIHWRFAEYLKEVLALTAAVYESPSFCYTEGLANSIFLQNLKITVNDFLDTLMSDPGPHCLIWLPLYHRMAAVENVAHPVMCDVCHKENFTGFRYRCQKCHSYQLCQDCFWRGKVSGTHNNDHETREYSSFKSPSKQIGHSLRKSFRCVPEKGKNSLPRFPEQPEKTLDLSHIVPPSPLPSHNGFPDPGFMAPFDSGSMDSRSTLRSMDSSRLDDEHKLIARYAQRLAQEVRTMPRAASRMSQADQAGRAPSDANLASLDASRTQRELISQLEAKNKEIIREIARLRRQQEIEAAGLENPALMSELRALRQRKDELETHLATLQDSRRQLMVQLEGLMKMLKNHQASPRSTPNSSPRSTKSPPLPPGAVSSSRSAPPTPGGPLSTTPQQQQQQSQNQQQMSQSYQNPVPTTSVANVPSNAMLGTIQNPIPDNLSCVGGDVRSAFRTNSLPGSGSSSANNSLGRSLRNDLLVAADSVTNAMSTLVRELNSDFEAGEDGDDSSGGGNSWREELQRRYQQGKPSATPSMIIGQRDISSFHAISELTHIQELWIVECGLQDIPPFKENCPLKELYLYSNEISCVSNLETCTFLTTLYLSGNNIQSLQTLTDLPWLENLNLADNKLKRINKYSLKKSKLRYLNLAGNQLCFIREIRNLSQLQKLRSLVFADLLHGECPIVALCNYLTRLCKQFLEESLCSVIKHDIGITGLRLYKVTEVCNKELDQLNLCNDDNLQSNECNMILKILTIPEVTDIQIWPFNFFKTDLFTNEKLTVTNCLAVADSEWLSKMLTTKKHGNILNLLDNFERRRVLSNVLQKALKIQDLCAICCSLTTFHIPMPLKYLVRLNLGSNFISVLNEFTQKNFPSLKYLDLTNNLITTLEPMGSFCTLEEFYCSNNKIQNLLQIDNVKTWQMLNVIDLSNNPIHKEALYKEFIIFHLSNIKYISGERIQSSDITKAEGIFGNKLDNYVLTTMYKTDRLTTITQLSIINCSLSKVCHLLF